MSIPMGQAGTHALVAVNAYALGIVKVNQRRIAVSQHILQITVRANCGAKALTEEYKIQQREQRNARAQNAAGGTDIQREQTVKQIRRLNKERDEDEAHKDRGGQQHR